MSEQFTTRREARAAEAARKAAETTGSWAPGAAHPGGASDATAVPPVVPAPEAVAAHTLGVLAPDPADTVLDFTPDLLPSGVAAPADTARVPVPAASDDRDEDRRRDDRDDHDDEPPTAGGTETAEFAGIDAIAGLFTDGVQIVDPEGDDGGTTASVADLGEAAPAAPTSRRERRALERAVLAPDDDLSSVALAAVSVDAIARDDAAQRREAEEYPEHLRMLTPDWSVAAPAPEGALEPLQAEAVPPTHEELQALWERPARPSLRADDATGRARGARKTPRRGLRAALAVAISASFVATAALPASAVQIQAPTAGSSAVHSQAQIVAAGDVMAALEEHGFVAQAIGANQTPVDDYPFAGQFGMSSLLYYMGQCVDFVAWRVNRDMGWESGPWLVSWGKGLPPGSAWMWGSTWEYGSGSEPLVGSVAWWSANHVAYVNAVYDDGTIQIEEYNWAGSSAYHVRVIPASSVDLYLYPPSLPEGQVQSDS